jgi:hypothetical protein
MLRDLDKQVYSLLAILLIALIFVSLRRVVFLSFPEFMHTSLKLVD